MWLVYLVFVFVNVAEVFKIHTLPPKAHVPTVLCTRIIFSVGMLHRFFIQQAQWCLFIVWSILVSVNVIWGFMLGLIVCTATDSAKTDDKKKPDEKGKGREPSSSNLRDPDAPKSPNVSDAESVSTLFLLCSFFI